ncbi:histidine phosphatase family protein [Aureimonas psammosilenae]|uniref:histidine phosphatase family protein n=1 Tax=Aureimonas psammosilenae TaxID=2495496 RepID=UPI001260AB90|nr:histidine phosphatase family protein [Aureimonas psammosilenae]
MPDFLILRHAPTEWNRLGRMQGRADPDLSSQGLSEARSWTLPSFSRSWPCLSSPLARARQTAEALGLTPIVNPSFIEMDWGAFEGRTLEELRADEAFAANEARGLDFRGEGGESPREVGARALAGLATLEEDSIVVTHKGVIRALLAVAWPWNMTGKAPVKLRPASAHLFRLEAGGALALAQANIPLEAKAS